MNFKLEAAFSETEVISKTDDLKKEIDSKRPLPADVEGKVMQKLRLDWNYHSNAIEGNRLTYGETVAFLMEGITAKGKPLKDHLDIRGHNDAINFLLDIVKDTRPLSEADVRSLHKMILVEPYNVSAQTSDGLPTTKRVALGEYKTQPNHVQTATGETHYYASPEDTPSKMHELMEWYSEVSVNKEIHPVVIAALFHHKFVAIHPFDDGNGRLSRILMNLILMKNGYPPVVIKMDDRQNYYSLLSRADNSDAWPFVEYIADRLTFSQKLYLKAAVGEDINEDEDIDKEIALLQMQLSGNMTVREKKSISTIERVFLENILPLSQQIIIRLAAFRSFFFGRDDLFYLCGKNVFDITEHSIFIDDQSVDNYKKRITYELQEIIISINFREYKNIKNKFDLPVNAVVTLEEFHYNVFVDNQLIVAKLYHENLETEDENQIIKIIIQNLKHQLDIKLKSPGS